MRRRIVICLGVLFAICLLGDAIVMIWLDRSVGHLSALVDSLQIQTMRANLASAAIRVEADFLACARGDRPADQHDLIVRRLERSLGQCRACHHVPEMASKFDELSRNLAQYQEVVSRYFAEGPTTVSAGSAEPGRDGEDRRAALHNQALGLAELLSSESVAMADRAAIHISQRDATIRASIRTAWLVLTGTLLVLLIVGGVVALHLKRRLTRPVEALLAGIERVRGGDLCHRFAPEGDEEFVAVAEALNRAHASLESAQEGAYQAEKMAAVGRLAAGVAHEVGNPLASISSIAQVMRRNPQPDRLEEHVTLILDQVRRISRIVRGLLDFSKPGRAEDTQPVNLAAVVEQAVTLLRFDPRAKHIRIRTHLERNLPAVRGDPDRVLLVLTNIMINAVDAMGSGQDGDGRLELRAWVKGRDVIVQVGDTGPGMTDEQIARAFEPFYTTKDAQSGTGLGLWVCYEIVRRYGGSIRIHGCPGEGTTVEIALPAEVTAPVEPAGPPRLSKAGSARPDNNTNPDAQTENDVPTDAPTGAPGASGHSVSRLP